MKKSIKKGLGFGLTSGIITTIGIIIGFYTSIGSKAAIIGGILIIAFADAMSDALGMHISEEADDKTKEKHVWEATLSTFVFKLIFASSFIIPFLIFPLGTAVIISLVYGAVLISLFSFYIGKKRKESTGKIIAEHLIIMFLVIVAAHFIGEFVRTLFS